MNIGIISDTHGLLRPEAMSALEGCDLILHAGDVGSQCLLDRLQELVPLVAVRGNCDCGDWADRLAESETVLVEDTTIYMLHDLADMEIAKPPIGTGVVISGHSHKPLAERRGGILYLNPGSAGRRRFKLPITLARLKVGGSELDWEILDLFAAQG